MANPSALSYRRRQFAIGNQIQIVKGSALKECIIKAFHAIQSHRRNGTACTVLEHNNRTQERLFKSRDQVCWCFQYVPGAVQSATYLDQFC